MIVTMLNTQPRLTLTNNYASLVYCTTFRRIASTSTWVTIVQRGYWHYAPVRKYSAQFTVPISGVR